jgi:hypothetical protein
MNVNATMFETIERARDKYWAADEACDFRKRDRLGRRIIELEEAEMAMPARSNADAAAKLRFAAWKLELSGGDSDGVELARLERIAGAIGTSDSPRDQFELHLYLDELRLCALWLRLRTLYGFEESILRRIEAAIAWLERPRIEHYPSAKARIYYVSPSFTMIGGDGEPVPAELSHLSVLSVA